MSCSHARGEQIQNTLSILDLNNFGVGKMNKRVYALIKSAMSIMQNNYPENLGKSYIVNAPMLFKGVWVIISKFLDEKTVAKVSVHRYGQDELKQAVDEDQLIDFLGGKCTAKLEDDFGPWKQYEFFDGHTKGAVVGVRRKDRPDDPIFTPAMMEALPN